MISYITTYCTYRKYNGRRERKTTTMFSHLQLLLDEESFNTGTGGEHKSGTGMRDWWVIGDFELGKLTGCLTDSTMS